jgi:hypothetical protein
LSRHDLTNDGHFAASLELALIRVIFEQPLDIPGTKAEKATTIR